jgi:hypothetical protein
MIWGTRGIAVALFGPEHAHEHKRTLYSLIARGKIPTFRMGRTPCAWSDQIEDFLEGKAREATSNMVTQESRVAPAEVDLTGARHCHYRCTPAGSSSGAPMHSIGSPACHGKKPIYC